MIPHSEEITSSLEMWELEREVLDTLKVLLADVNLERSMLLALEVLALGAFSSVINAGELSGSGNIQLLLLRLLLSLLELLLPWTLPAGLITLGYRWFRPLITSTAETAGRAFEFQIVQVDDFP